VYVDLGQNKIRNLEKENFIRSILNINFEKFSSNENLLTKIWLSDKFEKGWDKDIGSVSLVNSILT
jgi:hypothetical protein